ncbi:MAG: glycerol kinase GlpK [Acidobacteria bacterium]|nr:glycerol kinase GlpK [Acidobacteriota bacterium]
MTKKFIIALDQGTTSSRSVLFDETGALVDVAQREFTQIFPASGWVEHDPAEILESQFGTLREVIAKNGVAADAIAALGITNQRETTVVWDRSTGRAICNAIVWQDRRTAPICEELKARGLEDHIRRTTGLVVDSYFSATKLKWILDHTDGARDRARKGELAFGTIDTWLLWHLTGGRAHATDYSNASRTMLFDINNLCWDETLLAALEIPREILPEVRPSGHLFGEYELDGRKIPVAGIAGDQQAALFGQACFAPGTAKNTYGTGCFMLMNTGEKPQFSGHGMLTTIAWGIEDTITYALEGSVFIAGASVQWLRDGLQFFAAASESERHALEVAGDNPVYVVPAFAGLGAPYWDMYARGAVFGLTRDTGKNHITRATLESIAYQTKDILDAMERDSGIRLAALKVDGGAAANDFLMQFQADILDVPVERPEIIESTALGAAYLAGLTVGLWKKEDVEDARRIEKTFAPAMDEARRARLYKGWQKAVRRTMNWERDED